MNYSRKVQQREYVFCDNFSFDFFLYILDYEKFSQEHVNKEQCYNKNGFPIKLLAENAVTVNLSEELRKHRDLFEEYPNQNNYFSDNIDRQSKRNNYIEIGGGSIIAPCAVLSHRKRACGAKGVSYTFRELCPRNMSSDIMI